MTTQDRPFGQGQWRTPPNGPLDDARPVSTPGPQNPQPFPKPPPPHMYSHGVFQPAYAYTPPPPPRSTNYAKVFALVALALLAIGVLVLVVVGLHLSGSATTPGGGIATSAPVASVCKPGSYKRPSQRDAPTFQGANDTAVCTATVAAFPDAPVPSERHGSIWIVQFSSLGAARNEAMTERFVGATAIGAIGEKNVLFVATADWTGAALEPLTQFGFLITPAR